jgi:hypothetical protein
MPLNMLSQKVYNIAMSHFLSGCSDHREPKHIWKKRSAPEGIDPGPIHVHRSYFLFFWRQGIAFADHRAIITTTFYATPDHKIDRAFCLVDRTRPHIYELFFGVHATQYVDKC